MGLGFLLIYLYKTVPFGSIQSHPSPRFFGVIFWGHFFLSGGVTPKNDPTSGRKLRGDNDMLTDTKIKQAKPADKMYKLYDELGLYLEILPTGHKRWCWKYRFAGKEKLLRFRSYPVVTLKMARDEPSRRRMFWPW